MSTFLQTFTTLPYAQFRRDKYFYVWYDAFYFALGTTFIALIVALRWPGLTTQWDLRLLWLLPLVCYFLILSNVWVHNAAHANFPRPINRLIGEICGFIVLVRFASWEIIHHRHHYHPDDVAFDPHPMAADRVGYWGYLARTITSVEAQLQQMFLERYGDTEANRRFQRQRAPLSFVTSFLVIPAVIYLFIGAPAFVLLFLPAAVVAFLQLIHFNWSTHNPWSREGDFRPVNLNHGFYRIGNWIWHGIYFHANHHRHAGLFNPAKMPADKALPVIRPGESTAHYPTLKRQSRTPDTVLARQAEERAARAEPKVDPLFVNSEHAAPVDCESTASKAL